MVPCTMQTSEITNTCNAQEGMGSEDAATRQGVCYGIQEVLANVSRTQLADMLPQLLPTVQTALCDTDASVRAVRLSAHRLYWIRLFSLLYFIVSRTVAWNK